jgi:hypothetical protein
MTYEEIGKFAYDYFIAERERINARIQRAIARDGHKCVVEKEYSENETGASASFCYHPQGWRGELLPFSEWCDNCKYVQPFHLAYIASARKAQKARYQLTRRIKIMLDNQVDN